MKHAVLNSLMQFNRISLIQQAKGSHICWTKLFKKKTIVFPVPHTLQNFLIICAIFRSGSQGRRSGRKKPKYDKLVGKTFVKEVLLLCLFGMALPTVDVYSDGALIIQLYVGIPEEFKCLSDGKIIPAGWVRSGYDHCSDGSDERGKKTILYQKTHTQVKQPRISSLLTFVGQSAGKPVQCKF